jgi:hypothetical protein
MNLYRHTQIDVGDRVLVDGCLVHVTGYEVQGVRVQGGGGRARQVQARRGGRYKVVFAGLLLKSSVADPGRLSQIPDPNFFYPGSRIRIKEFGILTKNSL